MTKFLVFVAWVLLLTLCPMPTGVRVGLGFVVGVWYLSAFFRHSDKEYRVGRAVRNIDARKEAHKRIKERDEREGQ